MSDFWRDRVLLEDAEDAASAIDLARRIVAMYENGAKCWGDIDVRLARQVLRGAA